MLAIVSIHAPTRGATKTVLRYSKESLCFNPRPHEGSDLKEPLETLEKEGFNPRPHEGSDQI